MHQENGQDTKNEEAEEEEVGGGGGGVTSSGNDKFAFGRKGCEMWAREMIV